MTDTTEIAARYGVPTPEALAAEYQKRGMRWTDGAFYMGTGDTVDGCECCCAVGMLVLIETNDLDILPYMDPGTAWARLHRLPREFINGIIAGNDGDPKPDSSHFTSEYRDGWEYGRFMRLVGCDA